MEYRIGGNILDVDIEVLVKGLLEILPEVKHRPRLFGYDINYINEEIELHIQTFGANSYSLEMTFYGVEKDLVAFLMLLRDKFIVLELKFDLWYCEEDE